METILQLSRRHLNNNNHHHHHATSPAPSASSSMDMKYSPTDSLKLSSREANAKRIERRKPNWTEAENVFLLDQFGLHREILTCKATDASTNLKKQEIWRLICQNLNTHNTLVRRTPAEVRRKWKNLVTAAKKEVWEMRHQIHLNGGSGGANGRKISELSQRVLQLHSSGGFSNANPNGLYGTLLSAGLLGSPDKYHNHHNHHHHQDKGFIPAHFTPIITLSESNNNHIASLMGNGNGPPSPLSDEDNDDDGGESSDSRNATEFMSDSGIYEQEGIDLRVNVSTARNNNHNYNSVGSVGVGGNGKTINGGTNLTNGHGHHTRKQLLNTSDPGGDEDEDIIDDVDDDDCDDVEVEDMPLIRFASHLGLRENKNNKSASPNPFITSALLNNNRDACKNNYEGAIVKKPEDHPLNNTNNNPIMDGAALIDSSLKLRNHFLASLKESDLLGSLYKERLELQIEVLKLRKQKLSQELDAKKKVSRSTNGVLVKKPLKNSKNPPCRRKAFNSYFRLKPKNTWMNFAAKEELLNEKTGSKSASPPLLPMVNGMVNGIKGESNSDHEEDVKG